MSAQDGGFLDGVRVVELADEMGEYCGKILAGLGADVVKIEPPGGEVTRHYGPFYKDEEDPNKSLHFWHYNLGKRGAILDLETEDGLAALRGLVEHADVIVDARRTSMGAFEPTYDQVRQINPDIICARITPFGDDGPWSKYKAGDLIHLALGGVVMNCGYDPEPDGTYDLPPIAPQMWQAYHIAGDMAAIAIVGALIARLDGHGGQQLSVSVHEAVSASTETDWPNWVYLRKSHQRLTCRHSMPHATLPSLSATKDGRWLLPYKSYLPGILEGWDGTVRLLAKYGMSDDLPTSNLEDRAANSDRISSRIDRLCGALRFERDLWRDAQALGLPWAPIRRPEENLTDEHWAHRDTFFDIGHPEVGESFRYVGAKWLCPEVPWSRGPRAPLLDEHGSELEAIAATWARRSRPSVSCQSQPQTVSPLGKPFALAGVRVVDLSWLLASAGAGRFLAALGADVIKVEHESRWDAMRWGPAGQCPPGGRAQRDAATGPLEQPNVPSPNRAGFFSEINSGKRAISLNLKSEIGKSLLRRLIAEADMVVEGFSPGTLERLGFGYDALKKIKPDIIYVQQSGMGQIGTLGAAKSFGPTAQALAGLSEMSGLPEPYAPAGIGYSFLDWYGAYNMALAMMAALYRKRRTGKGCYIDASQVEAGTYLVGSSVLNASVNQRRWQRYGNRSPWKRAAPHGVYRTFGVDQWLAISCFTEEEWGSFLRVLGEPKALMAAEFSLLEDRIAAQDELDHLVGHEVAAHDAYQLMDRLQAAGVPAGVCQDAQGRYERDPQLQHGAWLTELRQSEIGVWPVKNFPVRLSATPAYIGGPVDRAGPNYGEDNGAVYQGLLEISDPEYEELRESGVI